MAEHERLDAGRLPHRALGRLRVAVLAVVLAPVLMVTGCVVSTGAGAGPPATSAACGTGGHLVPLRVVHGPASTLALLEVGINGQGPYVFVLDTGASSTVVDVNVADRLGLPRSGRTQRITGVVGTDKVPLASVESLRLGDVDFGPVQVALVDLPDAERGQGLQGLVGSDVLSRFGCVVVDYAGQHLELPAGAGGSTGGGAGPATTG